MTIRDVRGFGRQRGRIERYRGWELEVAFLPKLELEMVVQDDAVEKVTKTLMEACRTGRIGDGMVFVSALEEAVRIRTRERGEVAVSDVV
jgi:nitrogen regulatory protein P-II 1